MINSIISMQIKQLFELALWASCTYNILTNLPTPQTCLIIKFQLPVKQCKGRIPYSGYKLCQTWANRHDLYVIH